MKYLLLVSSLLLANTGYTQENNSELEILKNLVGGTWVAEGEWGDGSPFKQEITFETGISENVLKTKTWGNITESGYRHGLRSEGFRVWDASDSTFKFWEFDVFGSVIEGEIEVIEKDIYHSYTYNFDSGPMKLTDGWIYTSDNEYQFIVGVFEDGYWKQKYISTSIKRIPD